MRKLRCSANPVEVLKILHRPRKFNPLVNWLPYPTPTDEVYSSLSIADQTRLAEYAASLIGTARNDEAEDITLCLAAFTNANLDNCLRTLVNAGSIWPSLPFYRSPSDVRDELIARVDEDASNRNHILCALAWIGDQRIVELFARWRCDPPAWREGLHIPPEDYARQAGWELTDDGRRRDLFLQRCTKLAKGASACPDTFVAISSRDDRCPWCGLALTNLLVYSAGALGADEVVPDRLQVLTCEVCTAFGVVYGSLDAQGTSRWSDSNVRPRLVPPDAARWGRLPTNALTPTNPRPPLFAADPSLPTTFSQLGGHPAWVQDAEYPRCPGCTKTMLFLGQIEHSEIERRAEGTFYAFVCPGCKTTATNYQQT